MLDSPFMIGILTILINIGSRFVTHEFSDNDEEYQQNIILRRLVIFAICFLATKDLVVSILLTAGYVIIASGILRGSGFAREGMKNKKEVTGQLSGKMTDDSPSLF